MKRRKIILLLTVLVLALVAVTVLLLNRKAQHEAVVQHSGHESSQRAEDKSSHQGHNTKSMEGMDMKEDKSMPGMPGMNMGQGSGTDLPHDIALHILLQPTNSYVVASIPVTGLSQGSENMDIELLGFTAYNTATVGSIAARITGRIEKLYVRYRFQKISRGQKIMEIYSPEFLTAQQNLLYIIKNDPTNTSLISSAKQRLLLLGFPEGQLQQVIRTGKPLFTVTVYSNYSGHIHETGAPGMGAEPAGGSAMSGSQLQQPLTTQELTVKEGMYVQKGQSIFRVYDPNRIWALLNIYPSEFPFVKVGKTAVVKPEGYPTKTFTGTIYYVEPFFRPGSRTVTARINIPNQQLKLPVGTQLRASLTNTSYKGDWLPREAVLSLGLDRVVFLKVDGGFRVQKIETGVTTGKMVQVLGGIGPKDSVAANAQYLVDSESFIKINDSL